ncbi:MAG: hypothetical protein WCA84_13490 [Ignavibacteriaceae bacterium]
MLRKIIHYYSTNFISGDIELNIPVGRLIELLRFEKTAGIDKGLEFSCSLIDVPNIVSWGFGGYANFLFAGG